MLYLTIQACEQRLYIKAFACLDSLNESFGDLQHLRNTRYEKRVSPYPVDRYNREG